MSEPAARKQQALKEPARPHQPGQATFRAILAEHIEWKPFATFPPEARLAVIVGNPSKQAPYMVRVKVPRAVVVERQSETFDRSGQGGFCRFSELLKSCVGVPENSCHS